MSTDKLDLPHCVRRHDEHSRSQPHRSMPTLLAGVMKLMARSASAAMVRLGLTPRLADTTDPSQMYIFW